MPHFSLHTSTNNVFRCSLSGDVVRSLRGFFHCGQVDRWKLRTSMSSWICFHPFLAFFWYFLGWTISYQETKLCRRWLQGKSPTVLQLWDRRLLFLVAILFSYFLPHLHYLRSHRWKYANKLTKIIQALPSLDSARPWPWFCSSLLLAPMVIGISIDSIWLFAWIVGKYISKIITVARAHGKKKFIFFMSRFHLLWRAKRNVGHRKQLRRHLDGDH